MKKPAGVGSTPKGNGIKEGKRVGSVLCRKLLVTGWQPVACFRFCPFNFIY